MRVGLVLTPVEFGGAERVCLTLLESISHDRFDVCPILLTRPWEKQNAFVREVEAIGYQCEEVPVALRPNEGPWRVARCFALIRGIIRRRQCQIIHTNGYFADIVGISVAKAMGLPVIATCHGFIANTSTYRFYNMLDRVALRGAARVIAVSGGIRDHLVDHGIDKGRITLIENAVSLQKFGDIKKNSDTPAMCGADEGSKRVVLGYVGRLSAEKGVRFLLEASSLLAARGTACEVCIVGDGPERESLERAVDLAQTQLRVQFAGFQKDVQEWLGGMTVFVLPSLTEGTPVALLEAMASGVPVVGTAVGGVPNLIKDGVTGMLVPPGDPDAIANAVTRLVDDEGLARRVVQNAWALVAERYGTARWIKAIEAEYMSLSSMGSSGRPPRGPDHRLGC